MAKAKTVILRKLGKGLGGLNLQGGLKEYRQETMNRDHQGEYFGDYKERTLPGSRHYLAPIWNDLKDQWAWAGNQEDITRLLGVLRLRHDRGSEKGQIISPTSIDLKNREDAFFRNTYWTAKRYLAGGRLMLNLEVAEDEFFYLNYKGSHKVNDSTDPLNKAFIAGALYEIINPKTLVAKKAKDVKSEASAMRFLGGMELEKQKLIAEIMDLECDKEDPDSLFIGIVDQACKNTEIVARYGGKTAQDRFIDLAESPTEDLLVSAQIIRAKKARILVNKGQYTQFNTGGRKDAEGLLIKDRLEGVNTDLSLINYFRKLDNQEDYLQLIQELKLKGLET